MKDSKAEKRREMREKFVVNGDKHCKKDSGHLYSIPTNAILLVTLSKA